MDANTTKHILNGLALSAIMAAVALSAVGSVSEPYVLHVGTGGDIATPAEAVALLRTLRQSGAIADGREVVVDLAPGDYVLDSALTLTFSDSGSRKAPVVWRGSTNGISRILGNAPIPRSRFSPLPAADSNAARFPAESLEHILVADVGDLLPTTLPKWPDDKYFRAPPLPMLFLGGRFQEIARWPNRESDDVHGWARFRCTSLGDENGVGVRIVPAEDESRLLRWNSESQVWLHGYWGNTWREDYVKATISLGATNELVFAVKPQYIPTLGEKRGTKFVVLNIPEELDAPGEWWLDPELRRLYYWPPNGFASDEPVLVSFAGPLLAFVSGACDIRFEGIEFAYAESAFSIPGGASRIEFDRCNFHSFLESATVNGSCCKVRRSTFSHFAKECLSVTGGNRQTLSPALNLAEDCSFVDFQRLQQTSAPAVHLTDGCGNAVRGCRFSKSSHTAVLYSGNEHLVGWCEFSEVLRETEDCGAVYTGRNSSTHGTVIVRCDFHDIDTGDVTGIYFDDCDWGDDAYCCTFTNVYRPFLVGGGELHRIEWNAIKNATKQGIHVDRRGVMWADNPSFPWGDESWWSNCFTKAGIDVYSHPWNAAYPSIAGALEASPREPWNNVIQGNLMVDCTNKWTDINPNAGATSYYASTNHLTILNNVTASTTGKPGAGIVGFTHLDRDATFADVPGMVDAYRRANALEHPVSHEVSSPDGDFVVRVGLNVAARLSCSAEHGGDVVLDSSPIGVTVDGVDYGRMMVPCSNATCRTVTGEKAVPEASSAGYAEMVVPLEDVAHGGTNAQAEVRAFANGFAWRMRVFGAGERTVAGEVALWNVSSANLACSAIPTNGWTSQGEVVTPWHVAVIAEPVVTNGILLIDVPSGCECALSALERRLLRNDSVSGVVKTGAGTLLLVDSLAGYTGTWAISNGTVAVMARSDAFGSPGDAAVTIPAPAVMSVLASSRIQRPIAFVANNIKQLFVESSVDVRFERKVAVTGSSFRFVVNGGGSVVFSGGYDSRNTSAITSGGGVIVFDNEPSSMSLLYAQTNNKIYFNCPSNYVASITAAFSTSYADGIIALGCDDALSGYLKVAMGNIQAGTIDIAGHTLFTGSFSKFTGGTLTSSAPGGFLRVNQAKNVTNESCRVTGDLTISKTGNGEFRFARPVESSGALEVDQGVMRMTAAASWTNVACVVVSGSGTLAVEGVGQFGESPKVQVLGGGQIKVEAGSRLVCGSLKVDDKRVEEGVYRAGSNLPGCVFVGNGEIVVLPPPGTVVYLK